MLKAFDHVNVITANLDAMVAWYADVLGMKAGPRPDFPFPGAWLYLGDRAMVHLVGTDTPRADHEPRIEHFAFRAEGLTAFLDRLAARDLPYRIGEVADFGILQVNVWDPDGNHLHIDFGLAEKPNQTPRFA